MIFPCMELFFGDFPGFPVLEGTLKGRHTKEMLVIDEPAHVAVGLQSFGLSSITTPKQHTRYIFQRVLF